MNNKQLIEKLIQTRDDPRKFRETTAILAGLLAEECHKFIYGEQGEMSNGSGCIALLSILRAGNALLPEFQERFPYAKIAFIGAKREGSKETNHGVRVYDANISYDTLDSLRGLNIRALIILEPMLATGSTLEATKNLLALKKIRPKKILVASAFSAKLGEERLRENGLELEIFALKRGLSLTKEGYIKIPFGGRYTTLDFGKTFCGC